MKAISLRTIRAAALSSAICLAIFTGLLMAGASRGTAPVTAGEADQFASGVLEVPDHDAPEEPLTSDEDALAADAQAIADKFGWSQADTLLRLRHQEDFGELVVQLAKDYPDSFAGSWTSMDTALPDSFVRFKGSVPEAAVALAQSRGVSVTFQGDSTYSLSEMRERAAALYQELAALGSPEVATGVRASEQMIIASAVWPPGLQSLTADELVARLPDWAAAEDIAIDFTKGPLTQPAHTYGGAWMRDDGSRECTSGFTAVRNGITGVTTAGHCAGLNQYEQPSDGLVYSAPFVMQHTTTWGDFEFHTTSHPEYARFHADLGDFRSVHLMFLSEGISEGDAICGFGRKTLDKQCRTVWATFFTCGQYGHLLLTLDSIMASGDSGGPFFLGTTAYGDFYGWCFVGNSSHSVVSLADYFDEALDADILTE